MRLLKLWSFPGIFTKTMQNNFYDKMSFRSIYIVPSFCKILWLNSPNKTSKTVIIPPRNYSCRLGVSTCLLFKDRYWSVLHLYIINELTNDVIIFLYPDWLILRNFKFLSVGNTLFSFWLLVVHGNGGKFKIFIKLLSYLWG